MKWQACRRSFVRLIDCVVVAVLVVLVTVSLVARLVADQSVVAIVSSVVVQHDCRVFAAQ